MQSFSRPAAPPPTLLVLELWGLGDLALSVPFLQEATRRARVTLVARPEWAPLLAQFCPEVNHVPFVAPWTSFRDKYRLAAWPWRKLSVLIRQLRAARCDLGVSARVDPRDHLLLRLARVRRCVGFPRRGFGLLLQTRAGEGTHLHRAAAWELLAKTLGWTALSVPRAAPLRADGPLVLHSGAGQPTRIWPLDRFARLAARLRQAGFTVQVVCDAPQLAAWRQWGETNAQAPADLAALLDLLQNAALFVGNDSGPGHVAALCGVPTFTIFGPQLPSLFAPVHPRAAWIDGRPCRYKPCFDSCHYPEPHCLHEIAEDDVWPALSRWLALR